ncbi:LPXTG cell wall anchor domain-containing protein [Micromonospora sp. C31]|uniref:LPXTG cell wall anchor domain-containing protein n=1 Tax=Micromonospora sp. C31 TaxID=2824876 RepID=UPI001B378294|nr:LPXTG cell wall anchor domain-containing protein [Micromonospora sp. C31]MBQ1073576.1 LPXTG cell wall anchor domain-containing protein [Micromonospora sp. C31]
MAHRRRVVRAAVSTAAATACLALATPAWASGTIPINPDHRDETAGGFSTQDCADPRFGDRPAGHDGWHFVLPGGKASGGFETLTLTFATDTGEVTVTVPDADDAHPDALYPAGKNGSRLIHAYLFTPAGWTLLDGSATISGTAAKFNLSHTCAGTAPSQSPSPTPSPTTSQSPQPSESPSESTSPSDPASPSTPTTASPSTGPGGSGGGEGDLPLTGVATTSIALGGLALIGAGTLLMLRRRRDNVTFTS